MKTILDAIARWSKGHKTGVVEKYDFTWGGAGNQWTIIDGVIYATWWDARTMDWEIGDKVEHKPYTERMMFGGRPVLATTILRKMP